MVAEKRMRNGLGPLLPVSSTSVIVIQGSRMADDPYAGMPPLVAPHEARYDDKHGAIYGAILSPYVATSNEWIRA